VQNVEDVKTALITARRVIFTPSKEVKDELQATKIAITCFDKDGKIVKRVTSADSNDVEDPEGDETGGSDGKTGDNENENQNENENENQNENPGGGGGTEDGTDES
jgi:hypothetical protein